MGETAVKTSFPFSPQTVFTTVEHEYWVLRKTCGLAFEERGVLSMTGNDSVDFLQRLSTNDFINFAKGSCITTVLTTEKAKIVDVCTVLHHGENLLILTSKGNSQNVKLWLEKFVIMEDIHVKDISSDFTIVSLVGPQSHLLINKSLNFSTGGFSENHFYHNQDVLVYRDDMFTTPKFLFLGTKKSIDCMLLSDNAERLHFIGSDAVDLIRVEDGVPLFGKEITESFNPLETSLDRFISFTKGCYIGQEVIARLDTYKKLQKKLTTFIIESEQSDVIHEGKLYFKHGEIGWITSFAWSYAFSKWVALGFLKTGINEDIFTLENSENTYSYVVKRSTFPLALN